MRRTLLLCAVLMLGCAKTETPSTESTPTMATISLADVAGTWDGTVMTAADDTVRAIIELTATAEPTGWSMKVANAATPTEMITVPATNVMAEGDSVIVDAGPFPSQLRPGQQVATHSVYRLEDGRLVGTIQATYPASGEMVVLRSVASRK